MQVDQENTLGNLPRVKSTNSSINRLRSKKMSRISLVNALKTYTSSEAMNCPTFDVVKETMKWGFRKRQKRYVASISPIASSDNYHVEPWKLILKANL